MIPQLLTEKIVLAHSEISFAWNAFWYLQDVVQTHILCITEKSDAS